MRILKKLLAGFTGLFAFSFFICAITEENHILFLILGALMAVCTVLLFKSADKQQQELGDDGKPIKKPKSYVMKHVNGLPIAEDAICNIVSEEDKFIFTSGTMHFELDKSKITDMCIKTDKEIQEQYVSSVGGAVGGALLFGPIGAVIGGRAKKKTIKNEIHNILIITYQSTEVKYIAFDICNAILFANRCVKEFCNSDTAHSTYQL